MPFTPVPLDKVMVWDTLDAALVAVIVALLVGIVKLVEAPAAGAVPAVAVQVGVPYDVQVMSVFLVTPTGTAYPHL